MYLMTVIRIQKICDSRQKVSKFFLRCQILSDCKIIKIVAYKIKGREAHKEKVSSITPALKRSLSTRTPLVFYVLWSCERCLNVKDSPTTALYNMLFHV